MSYDNNAAVGLGQEVKQPVQRPEGPGGYGTIGRRVPIVVNAYDVQLAKPEGYWAQYAVSITSAPRQGKDGKDRPTSLPPKDMLRKIWHELELTHPWGDVMPVYDGRHLCFSPCKLPGVGESMTYDVAYAGQRSTFKVQIYNPVVIDVDHLVTFFSTRQGVALGDVNPALVALNTLIVHGFSLLCPTNESTFFLQDPQRYNLGGPLHRPFQVGGGIELWRGFFTSLRPTLNSLLLNVDTTTGAFVRGGNLMQVCFELGGVRLNQLAPRDRIKINRILKGCRMDVDPRCSTRSGKPQTHLKIQFGLTLKTPRSQQFELRNSDGSEKTISVEAYYLEQYGVHLREPSLPMIETRTGTFYPIELCSLTTGNKYNKRLNPQQTAAGKDMQILKPRERISAVQAIRANAIAQVCGAHLQQFGVTFGPEPKAIEGRLLMPPTIEYAGQSQSRVEQGGWRVEKRRQQLIKPARLTSFGVILGSSRVRGEAVYNFLTALFGEARSLGMGVPHVPSLPSFFIDGARDIDGAFAEAVHEAGRAFGKPAEIVFAFFDGMSDAYDRFKALGLMQAIVTQPLRMDRVGGKTRDFQTLLNISMKINAKLRGSNFGHVRGTTSGQPGQGSWFENTPALVFGCDLSHMDGKPSIASVVMSVDRAAQVYIEESVVRALREPSGESETQRAKRNEIIVELEAMVFKLLSRFEQKNPGKEPGSLFFVRDGVSDGEWEAVLEKEVPAIRAACERLVKEYPNTIGVKGWVPKITFVLSAKRHHIRFFPAPPGGGDRNGNVPPGLVVDRGVGDPRVLDWYAASHAAIIGTARPCHYVAMTDENRLSADDLQGLTAALTHSYQRCNWAVSIPAPVYYADLLAGRLRAMINASIQAAGGPGAPSTTGTDGTADSAQRAADLRDYQNAMIEFEQGREVLGACNGVMPSMWWL